jgi:hypothetical protein
MQTLYIIVQLLSAASAFVAAVYWLKASIDRAAHQIMKEIEELGGPDVFGSHETQLVTAVIKQSRLNATAAIWAAGAAILQAIAIIISLVSARDFIHVIL